MNTSKVLSILSVFSSSSTLFCCALPSLFVLLGAGATFSSLLSQVPQLTWVSEHRIFFFVFAGCMLTLAGTTRYLNHKKQCCSAVSGRKKDFTAWIFWFSLTLYLLGGFFSFVAPRIFS